MPAAGFGGSAVGGGVGGAGGMGIGRGTSQPPPMSMQLPAYGQNYAATTAAPQAAAKDPFADLGVGI